MATPTILDSLVIELGLDSSRFRAGADEAERGARKARDETEKASKDIQKSVGEGVSNAFQTATRHAIEFFAVLAGARTLEQFTVNVTASATQLGIMSHVLGMTPQRISAIALAVERTGGSYEATIQSLARVKSKMTEISTSGGNVPVEWQKLGVDVRSAQSPEELINRTLDAFKTNPWGRSLDQSQQIAILQWLGVDQNYATFLVTRGSAGEKEAVAQAEKDATTPAQVAAATQLTAAWYGAAQAVRSVGREIVRYIAPAVSHMLNGLREIVEANKGAITDWFGTHVKEAVAWISDPANWKGAKELFDELYGKIHYLADLTDGWENLTELLVGVWAIDKIAPIITSVGLLTAAFVGLSRSMLFAEGGLLATAVAALAVGFLVTEGTHPPVDEDAAARAKLNLMGKPNPTAEEVRKMKQYDQQPWWGRLLNTPDSYDESLKRHRAGPYADQPISTSEGPVSESRPLPVKIVGAGGVTPAPSSPPPDATTAAPDAPADKPKGIVGKVTDWLFGGKGSSTSAPATPPTPPHTPTPSPEGHSQTLQQFRQQLDSGSSDAPGTYHLPAYHQSSLGGSGVFASGQAHVAQMAARGQSRVTVAALNITPGATTPSTRDDYFRKHIRQDFYAMKSDVGLAGILLLLITVGFLNNTLGDSLCQVSSTCGLIENTTAIISDVTGAPKTMVTYAVLGG